MKEFLVVGSTGSVGAEVVRALREREVNVRVLVRRLPRSTPNGVRAVLGSLEDSASLASALAGVDGAFFVTPHAANEGALGFNFMAACEAARVGRVVYSSALLPTSKNRLARWLIHAVVGAVFPHYRGKLAVERRVHASSVHGVILKPTNFYQNDEIVMEGIHNGVYAQAIGVRGLNRVDCADIGDAAARALLDDIPRGAYPVVGPQGWTQQECAEVWSRALGRPIAAGTWEDWKRYSASLDAAKSADFDKTLRLIQRLGTKSVGDGLAQTLSLLGRAPRSYERYVETVATM